MSWSNFSIRIPAVHREGNIYYRLFLPEHITTAQTGFHDYTFLDIISHVTTIKHATSIIDEGFSPCPINDYSIVSKVTMYDGSLHVHPLNSEKVIWISPSAEVPLQTSRYGNVAFSIDFNSVICSNVTKFYYVEFVQYKYERALRILLTNREYPLREFDPMDLSSPLFFDRLSERWQFANKHNSKNLTMEIITDINIQFHNVSYVNASRRRARIQGSNVVGYFPVFIDEKLGYLFYSIFKKKIQVKDQYKDVTERDRYCDQLISFLENMQQCGYNNSANKLDEKVDENQNADATVKLLTIPRCFRIPGGTFDWEDIKYIRVLYTLFHKYGKHPSTTACLSVFFEKTNSFTQEQYRDSLQSIDQLLGVFLNHFYTEEAKIIKEGFRQYVAEVHGRSLP